ncbi:hypothetical protein [Candidatus Harpocratesius sp.]
MDIIPIILIHFAIYAFPIFISALFKSKFQVFFTYAYLGVIFCLTKIFNSLYSVQLSDNFFLNGGDIAYSALMFTALFLILSHPEHEIVRNLIYFIFILNLFISFIFLFLSLIFTSSSQVIYLDYSKILIEFSCKSVFYSFVLISGEILLQLIIMRQFLSKVKNRIIASLMIIGIYIIVLVFDGILYPIGINILIPSANYSLKYSILAKVIFGTGFGLFIFIYLYFFHSNLEVLTSKKIPFIRYLLPPKHKSLLKKYKEAQNEIKELRKILPICANCKKIRTDEGYWEQLEEYLAKYNDFQFSHSYCPECAKKIIDNLNNQ